MHKCPDEQCKTEVDSMKTTINVWRIISVILGILIVPALGTGFIVWSDNRSASSRFCSIDRASIMEKQIAVTQADISYIRGSVDDTKAVVKDILAEIQKNNIHNRR